MKEILAKGIDISEHNGDVDIAGMKNEGIDFVIIRCGYGGDFSHQDDTWFEQNYRKCIESDMPWGVYLYSYGKSSEMALGEAAHTLRLLSGKKYPSYGVWYDVEDDALPSGNTLEGMCEAYCRKLTAEGYITGIYTYLSWLNEKDRLGGYYDNENLRKYPLWYAQYNHEINYAHPEEIDIWQYSESEVILGDKYDVNYAYRDFTQASRKIESSYRIYKYFEDIPLWGREVVSRCMEKGYISGVGKDEQGREILNISDDMLRMLVAVSKITGVG